MSTEKDSSGGLKFNTISVVNTTGYEITNVSVSIRANDYLTTSTWPKMASSQSLSGTFPEMPLFMMPPVIVVSFLDGAQNLVIGIVPAAGGPFNDLQVLLQGTEFSVTTLGIGISAKYIQSPCPN